MTPKDRPVNPNQTREKAAERFNSWPKWKREAYTYRKPGGCTCLDNNRCFGCISEDQMTASDHLKQAPANWHKSDHEDPCPGCDYNEARAATADHLKHRTGSLGGDQVSCELSNEQLEHIASNPDAALDYAAEACPEDLQQLAGELLAKRVIYESVSAALAHKTRECEDARRTSEYWKAEHLAGNKEIDALKAQVEQLGRQVAEMSSASETLITMLEATDTCLRSWNGTGSPVNIEYGIEQVRLASRARTK